TFFMFSFTSLFMTIGPLVKPPYLAVSLTLLHIPLIPYFWIRSTINLVHVGLQSMQFLAGNLPQPEFRKHSSPLMHILHRDLLVHQTSLFLPPLGMLFLLFQPLCYQFLLPRPEFCPKPF